MIRGFLSEIFPLYNEKYRMEYIVGIELTAEELKNVELGILKYFRDICKKLNLQYYLMGGTLLGAVRHQGFIPWDDDIDVMMPREDYDRLVNYFMQNDTEQYQLADNKILKEYTFPIGKLMDTRTELISNTVKTCRNAGAFIDIFPLDRVKGVDDIRERGQKLGKLNTFIHTFSRMLPNEVYNTYFEMSWKEKLIFSSYRIYGIQNLVNKYRRICCVYNKEKTGLSAYIGWILHDWEIWSDEMLGVGTELVFEGECFTVPKEYKNFLTIVYGDYMKLPPEEQRKTRHSFRVYWREAI